MAWTAARDAAVSQAYQDADRGRLGGPEATAAAQQSANDAGRRYEQANPPPTWVDGVEDGVAVRRFTSRPAESLLARVVGRVKAGAR